MAAKEIGMWLAQCYLQIHQDRQLLRGEAGEDHASLTPLPALLGRKKQPENPSSLRVTDWCRTSSWSRQTASSDPPPASLKLVSHHFQSCCPACSSSFRQEAPLT